MTSMFSYIVVLAAIGLVLYSPVALYLSPQPSRMQRTPRPDLIEDLLALELNSTLDCPPDAYSVHIYSKQPLVLYIENFLSADERAHILEISDALFEPATITHDGASTQRDSTIRASEVALVPRSPVVQCVEARARALQGWRTELWVERLRTQRYGAGGHYAHHFDWSPSRGGWGRVSSFMVWLDASGGDGEEESLQGGGTEFPRLACGDGRLGRQWERLAECRPHQVAVDADGSGAAEAVAGNATVFKPIPGNAVFWENFMLDGSGRGYPETWHAGLPVHKGVKVGLNIWSWGRLD